MAQIVRFTDNLDGTEHDEAGVKRGVVITVDGRKGKKPLDLTVATYEALVALSDGDADQVRTVFTPKLVVNGRHIRTPEEMEAIRVAARAATNPDGSRMFAKVNDSGRQTNAIYTWYETEFLPAQREQAAKETPTKA